MRDSIVAISNSDFLNWLICPGYAWMVRHRPDLAPPEDATARRKRLAGEAVEALARTGFPDGCLISADTPEDAISQTQQAIADGATTILHGAFMTDRGLLVEADVLAREGTGWHLIQIRGSAADPEKPNGLVKKYLPEITYQTLTLREAGLEIGRSSLLHINKHYRRRGSVQPTDILAMTDVTAFVAGSSQDVAAAIDAAAMCLHNVDVPAACDCDRKTRAHRCPMFEHFHPDIPDSGTIYHISGIHLNTLIPALDRGVIDLTDWPDDLPLSAKQRRQVEQARNGEEVIQPERLQRLLHSLRFPLQFLDYETFQQPIPLWEGFTPQQQVPFQYSLHIVDEDGRVDHREHMCTRRGENPVPGLVRNLQEDIGNSGSVIVWNKAFEESRNREMAHLMPEFASFLTGINRRMVDLADVVSKGWWVHPAFEGRWSLKTVLPVAAPDLCYETLEISDGGTASELWTRCMVDDIDTVTDAERAEVIDALRAYCSLDTLAMIRIWEHVRSLVAS